MKGNANSIRAVRTNQGMKNPKFDKDSCSPNQLRRDRETRSHMKQGGDNNAG